MVMEILDIFRFVCDFSFLVGLRVPTGSWARDAECREESCYSTTSSIHAPMSRNPEDCV